MSTVEANGRPTARQDPVTAASAQSSASVAAAAGSSRSTPATATLSAVSDGTQSFQKL